MSQFDNPDKKVIIIKPKIAEADQDIYNRSVLIGKVDAAGYLARNHQPETFEEKARFVRHYDLQLQRFARSKSGVDTGNPLDIFEDPEILGRAIGFRKTVGYILGK